MFNAIDYDENDILYPNIKIYDPGNGKTNKRNKNQKSLQLNLSSEELDTFCLYVNNLNSDVVSHSALVNAKTMFDLLDMKPYNVNDELRARLEYITLVLEARVNLNLDTKSLIKNHVLRNCDMRLKKYIEDEIIKDMSHAKISESTCKYLNSLIFENLIEGYSLDYSKRLSFMFEKKENGGYKRITEFSQDLKDLVKDIDLDIRKSEEFMREGKGFDLTSTNIRHEIKSIMKELRSPTNKLRTGLQYLNRMLNGGFESGRSYLFMGVTGIGKSIILLSVALWIKKYNDLPKRDGMKQAVLFISQENSKSETFERIFNINVSGKDIREFSDDDIEDSLRNIGLIVDNEDNDSINFIFKYFDDKEIGVSDIDAMISDYERQNIQIIAVVQDYIEKLKPKHSYSELRTSLGSIATEMSELAKARNIPFISAAQLNRMASSVVDNAIVNNKTNTTKLLGKNNISESWDMMKNVDAAVIINREIDDTVEPERQYMGFKLEKFRGKPNKDRIYVFLHPFDENNGILLTPDIEGKPLSRLSIEDFNPLGANNLNKGRPDFTDFDAEQDDFMASFVDIISEDYTDKKSNYVDLYKSAEKVVDKMKDLQQRELDIRERRRNEHKKSKKYYKLVDNRVIIHRKKYTADENGLIHIHRIVK